MTIPSPVHPIFARILDTMNGTHELSAEQRAELAKPMHADVRRQLESPSSTPTQPATKTVAGGGAGLCDELASIASDTAALGRRIDDERTRLRDSAERLREILRRTRQPDTMTPDERAAFYRDEPCERDEDDRGNGYSEREMIG